MRRLCVGVVVSLVIGSVASTSWAAYIFDTGAPDESANRSVFANTSLPGAQFLAQGFTLGGPTQIDAIEAYIGGAAGNSINSPPTAKLVAIDHPFRVRFQAFCSLRQGGVRMPRDSPNFSMDFQRTVSIGFMPSRRATDPVARRRRSRGKESLP